MSLADFLFGKPLASEDDDHQRVGPLAGVSILGLDALSSASYGPEALLTVLLPLGADSVRHVLPLTFLIVALLTLLYLSYRQTIDAYPSGGGAYTVTRENLGTTASLFAAAALSLDYLLNVAVAISAGVGALVSAAPPLLPYTLPLCLGILGLLTVINLRGVRATGAVFTAPTYLFVVCLFIVIGVGLVRTIAHGGQPHAAEAPPPPVAATGTASVWLLMRAFANGCTAMTGVEAVSNGVPIFHKPSEVGARRALAIIIGVLAILLVGIALLSRAYGITATPPGTVGYRSVLSQLASAAVGRGAFYYVTMASVFTVLALSANTSFADFPRLCRIVAFDRFLPEPFVHRGRRLAFSYGILVLCGLSGLLLIVFGGITDRLIPLFAIGALFAFTMSQAGMVMHWRRHPGRHSRHSLVLNAAGAIATAAALSVVLVSKLAEGAWITVLLVASMIVLFRQVRKHYDFVRAVTACDESVVVEPLPAPIAVLPLRRWDAVSVKALRFAITIASDVRVVQVLTENQKVDDLSTRWRDLVTCPASQSGVRPPELVVIRSEYRKILTPILGYVKELSRTHPDRQIAVIVPELVETHWYDYPLHNNTAALLKATILMHGGPQIVVVSTPWYLGDYVPERRILHWRRRARFFRRHGQGHGAPGRS